jgi:hypothetical protein
VYLPAQGGKCKKNHDGDKLTEKERRCLWMSGRMGDGVEHRRCCSEQFALSVSRFAADMGTKLLVEAKIFEKKRARCMRVLNDEGDTRKKLLNRICFGRAERRIRDAKRR